jgi:hypothetical protein
VSTTSEYLLSRKVQIRATKNVAKAKRALVASSSKFFPLTNVSMLPSFSSSGDSFASRYAEMKVDKKYPIGHEVFPFLSVGDASSYHPTQETANESQTKEEIPKRSGGNGPERFGESIEQPGMNFRECGL